MKQLFKLVFIIFLSFIFLVSSNRVYAWYTHEIHVTIVSDNEPYLVELLLPAENAPLLTDTEMNDLLDEEYQTASFKTALNGYKDADGYASSSLYGDMDVELHDVVQNEYSFTLYAISETPSYKIAVIFDDGSMITSSIVVQSLYSAEIIYDLNTVIFSESNPEPITVPIVDLGWTYYLAYIAEMLVTIIIILGLNALIGNVFGYLNKHFILITGLITIVMYVVMNVFLWIRDESMVHNNDFWFLWWPYFMIMFFTVFITISSVILSIKMPTHKPIRAILYVFISTAVLIVVTSYAYGMFGFLLLQ